MAIRATLDLEEASRRRWDVVAVGAGPAGSVAARELARQGAAVLLVDRACFPRWKVCGCCLNLRAYATLASIGLAGLMEQKRAQPLHRLRLAVHGRQAQIPVSGYALSREVFDASLVEASIQAGAHFLPETQARLGRVADQTRQVFLRQRGQETVLRAPLVLGAHGLAGKLFTGEGDQRRVVEMDSRLGAGAFSREAPVFYAAGCVFMASGQSGYVGLVRLEDDRLALAAAFDAGFVKQVGGLGKAAASILQEGGLPPVKDLETLPWQGTPLLTGRVHTPATERVFLLGDAAGYLEPFTGEGMAWALSSGTAVVPLALRACRSWDSSLAEQWSLLYRQKIIRRQWVCRLTAYALRRPVVMRLAVSALARFPILAAPFMSYLNQPSKKLGKKGVRNLFL